ncbi:hypothetical protein [Parasitella parasitica]|uniref:Uncharacterized protein n=1 Tax=Parasitella parasitica TaxID=35722 RepID=A0A0B7MXY7_9FUNG|nr:hypothetical protein [Parasitella parasitica]
MNSKASSQTIFSNLTLQNITSSEFSHFMGIGRFVQGASGHYDLYKNSLELINILGHATASGSSNEEVCSTTTTETKKPAAATEENQSTPVVEFGVQVLFPKATKKRVYTKEQDNEVATLASARAEIMEKFPGLQVSTSSIHSNLRQNCAVVVKASLDGSSVVELNKSMMFEEEVMVGMLFFTIYLHSNFGWSKGCLNDGEPVSARPSGIRIPLLVAMTSAGIQKLSVVSPVAVAKDGANDKKQYSKHYNQFIEEMIAGFDEGVDRTLLQFEMRRQLLTDDDPLLPRLVEAAKEIKWT